MSGVEELEDPELGQLYSSWITLHTSFSNCGPLVAGAVKYLFFRWEVHAGSDRGGGLQRLRGGEEVTHLQRPVRARGRS